MIYLVGAIGVAVVCSVPLNDALATIHPGSGAAKLWNEYLAKWAAWDHVRTTASLVAAAILAIALSAD